ncbi:MAG TPA: SDR family oxidoreductase [Hyphomicrobiaceae bacterium]|nr:SDR family oxidoreductase [Hyphomicrobiaceae bacterium]
MADVTSAGAGRVAVVTGGASGIGAATVAHLLDEGWRVAVLDLDTAQLAEARATYAGRRDVDVRALDVTDEAAVDLAINAIDDGFGPIAGVVNCAGIAADQHVLDTPVALFRKILDVNVVGTFLVGRAAARRMRERKAGAIVNIASISGLRGSKGRAAYGASKGAVVTLTQVMANDLAGDGLRVNAIAPGPVETPMVQAVHTDADRELFGRYVPMNRYGEPREIASVIAFLLDDKRAGFVTAEIVAVDGGYRGAGLIVRD